jgi:outer membrane protein
MKVFAATVALSVMLTAAPTFAQQAPAPTAPRPVAPSTAAQTPPPAAATRAPFPAGVKYAYLNLEEVFARSPEGAKVQTLINQRQSELAVAQKALQDAQAKAQQNASVMSDDAKAKAQADLERQDKDLQRKVEDAQAEVQSLQQSAQADWQKRIQPIVQKLAQDKGLHMLLSVPDSGLVWADPSLDLTEDLIKAQGSATAPAPAAAAPAARPSATTPTRPAPATGN